MLRISLLFLLTSLSGLSLFGQNTDGKATPQHVEATLTLDKLSGNAVPVTTAGETQSLASGNQMQANVDADLIIYRRCLQLRDFATAVDAAWRYYTRSGIESFQDSILALYVQSANFAPAVMLASQITERQPQNAFAWEMLAMTRQTLGQKERALAAYEKVYFLKKQPYHLYQVASLQFQLERIGESRKNTQNLLNSKIPITESVKLISEKDSQDVPLLAAAYNLYGNLALYNKDKKAARTSFEKALELFPDFLLAKGNLDKL